MHFEKSRSRWSRYKAAALLADAADATAADAAAHLAAAAAPLPHAHLTFVNTRLSFGASTKITSSIQTEEVDS